MSPAHIAEHHVIPTFHLYGISVIFCPQSLKKRRLEILHMGRGRITFDSKIKKHKILSDAEKLEIKRLRRERWLLMPAGPKFQSLSSAAKATDITNAHKMDIAVVQKHVHSLVKHHKTKNGIWMWQCNDPDCMYMIEASLIKNKRILCPVCKEHMFVLDTEHMRRTVPRCPQKCSTQAEHVAARANTSKTASVIDSLFPGADMMNPIGDD